MKYLILVLINLLVTEAAPASPSSARSSQVESRAKSGSVPCYLDCCKCLAPLIFQRIIPLVYHIFVFVFIVITIINVFIFLSLVYLGTPCARVQCLNGGYCIQPSTPTAIAYCHCPSQYTGYRCEQQAGKHSSVALFSFVCACWAYAICRQRDNDVRAGDGTLRNK